MESMYNIIGTQLIAMLFKNLKSECLNLAPIIYELKDFGEKTGCLSLSSLIIL